jgi:hypothetical protein
VGHLPHPPDDDPDDLLARGPLTGLECRKKLMEPAERVGSRHEHRGYVNRRQAA